MDQPPAAVGHNPKGGSLLLDERTWNLIKEEVRAFLN